ncbi:MULTISPECIES: glycoside hydrolase family 140 protein [unclassified Imperialibacter]|uniref:glycoside hydrolase family 140 protein n=1 Tax=unclassified Imperialibacter TaxID=2629706 RepID=UPI00125AE429|nr:MULTISPECIES: glycoside hydrolase family 140 protein [unclassified Imperialibacter]CAD5262960.1 conserved hypothetical protein [Imperialibacter sp. 75]CAD5275554.1 conserved hypothetical protein [Imperialibacter sp. 89]VVT08252.1 conserved hypothetical protein [Imperialibacter sp. EC-SDR9]
MRLLILFFLGLSVQAYGQVKQLPLKVSDSQRFLVYSDGSPFFYLGDTAWELFHRLNREDTDYYLQKRKEQGYTVIQAVVLAELDGLNTPNAQGNKPLVDNDPTKPNEAYFKDVDWVIQKAAEMGLFIGLLPTWGDKLFKNNWGTGPEIFNEKNAAIYGEYIGKRYKDQWNIIWILGGDRNPRNEADVAVWNAMAEGVAKGVGGYDKGLMTYHPQPHQNGGSSTWFHREQWLDFNMHQTGHCYENNRHEKITWDYNLTPTKPTLDGEPLYEEHPLCFNIKEHGVSNADNVRKLAYWQVFAGAAGHTYGSHAVWQMYDESREPVNSPQHTWKESLELTGGRQMGYVRKLVESRPMLERIPDQSMVLGENDPMQGYYISANRSSKGAFAFVYTPFGRVLNLNTTSLKGASLNVSWFNPRTGEMTTAVKMEKQPEMAFMPPSKGEGMDWVLVLDAVG